MSRAADRQYAQDELIFNVTEDILIAMEDAEISKAELARKLNKSKSRISSMLSGDANMTLRTLASICFEIGIKVDVRIGDEFSVRDPRSIPDNSSFSDSILDHVFEQEIYQGSDFMVKRPLRLVECGNDKGDRSPYESADYMDVA